MASPIAMKTVRTINANAGLCERPIAAGFRSQPHHKSAPALTASFNLRQFSLKSRPGTMEAALAVPQFIGENRTERERRKKLEERDRRWERKEIDERGVEAARLKQDKKGAEIKRMQDKQQRQETSRRLFSEAMARQRADEAERQKNIDEEARRIRLAREEMERLQNEEDERERQRRAPWTCEACMGGGICPACNGCRYQRGYYLTEKVTKDTAFEFGFTPQGCKICYGLSPGIRGDSVDGTGICSQCNGPGKMWPVLEKKQTVKTVQKTFTPNQIGVDESVKPP